MIFILFVALAIVAALYAAAAVLFIQAFGLTISLPVIILLAAAATVADFFISVSRAAR